MVKVKRDNEGSIKRSLNVCIRLNMFIILTHTICNCLTKSLTSGNGSRNGVLNTFTFKGPGWHLNDLVFDVPTPDR